MLVFNLNLILINLIKYLLPENIITLFGDWGVIFFDRVHKSDKKGLIELFFSNLIDKLLFESLYLLFSLLFTHILLFLFLLQEILVVFERNFAIFYEQLIEIFYCDFRIIHNLLRLSNVTNKFLTLTSKDEIFLIISHHNILLLPIFNYFHIILKIVPIRFP